MEEQSNNSEEIFFIPKSNIRSVEKNILAQLEKFSKNISGRTYLETYKVCDEVKNQILNYQDEPILSKTHNNYRRIVIASELFIRICSIYDHVVDYEFTKIVRDMVEREKYDTISKIITQNLKLQVKRQKYFAKEAKNMLVKTPEDTEKRSEDNTEVEERAFVENGGQEPMGRAGQTSGTTSRLEPSPKEHKLAEAPETIQHETLDDIMSHITTELTNLRAEPIHDTSQLQYTISNMLEQNVTLPDSLAGISIEDIRRQSRIEDDIGQILKVLEGQNPEGEIDKPEQLEFAEKITKVPDDASPNGKRVDEEESEEWTLPRLEPIKIEKKERHLKIDRVTLIRDYAAKAVQLNKNIKVERVQVFEGPPRVLQAMSVNHLMTTQSYKKLLFHDERSSRINKLYERHLKVDKKPVESVILQTRKTEQQREVDIWKVRTNFDVIEKLGAPLGMRAELEKGEVLAEIPPAPAPEKVQKDSVLGLQSNQSLIGVPISRIINGIIEPPEGLMERINTAPVLPVARAHEMQGKSLEPKTSPPLFISIIENHPSEKFKEFNYVYNKLQKYWYLFENQGMEKCINLKEFLSFEEDETIPNFLTLLRIIDKLSIQRKLVVEYRNPDVYVRPFEIPYVSEIQMALKGKEPVL